MVFPSFLSPKVPSLKFDRTSAHIACLSERSAALAKRRLRRFANSHARVASATVSRGVFNPSCGCFRKKPFYLSLFQSNNRRQKCRRIIISRRLCAELLFFVVCAPNYYLPSPVRRITIFRLLSPTKIFSLPTRSDNQAAPTVSNRLRWSFRRFCRRKCRR